MRENMRREKRTRYVPRSLIRYVDLYISEIGAPILVPCNQWNPDTERFPVGRKIGTIDLWKHGMERIENLYAVPIHELIKWAKEK